MTDVASAHARSLTIDGVEIHDGGDCYVVAEVGHNHQGDVALAKRLIDTAKDCGVDAVKLQKRSNRALYTREFYEQPYANELSFGRTYGEHREALELDQDAYRELLDHARLVGVTVFATAFDDYAIRATVYVTISFIDGTSPWIAPDGDGAMMSADQLRSDERRDTVRRDPGERIRQAARDGDRGIGERRGGGEPVRRADVRRHRSRHRVRRAWCDEADAGDEPEGGDPLGKPLGSASAGFQRRIEHRQRKHQMRDDGAGNPARDQ